VEQPKPDHQDWTWVLDRPCDECGFDTAGIERTDIGAMMRSNAGQWRELLSNRGRVSTRPPGEPDEGPIWSALEYGAHVRDIYRLSLERLRSMLSDDNPSFADRDQNQMAIDGGYPTEDPTRVSYDLTVEAGRLADAVDRVGARQWDRPARRSNGSVFTVESFVRYTLHDVLHHVADVERGYRDLAEKN